MPVFHCTRDFLVRDFATMLPKDRVVLEMLETIEIDDDVFAHVRGLKEIASGGEIRNALLGKSNVSRGILDLVTNYERGNWNEISREARRLGIADEAITERYLESVDWAQQVLSGPSVAELKPA